MKQTLQRVLRWTLHLVFHNFGWKLLALAIAVVLWAVVASEPELSEYATVRLEYRNLPDDLEIGSDPVSQVSLELRGPSGELWEMASSPRWFWTCRTFNLESARSRLARAM
jgi:hypothetical protein